MSLTREEVLGAQDRKTLEVETPEWGGSVFVRMLTGAERDELESAISTAVKVGNAAVGARARFCAAFICDSEGVPLFTLEDVSALAAKASTALNRVATVGMKLNAMRKRDLEELEKN